MKLSVIKARCYLNFNAPNYHLMKPAWGKIVSLDFSDCIMEQQPKKLSSPPLLVLNLSGYSQNDILLSGVLTGVKSSRCLLEPEQKLHSGIELSPEQRWARHPSSQSWTKQS